VGQRQEAQPAGLRQETQPAGLRPAADRTNPAVDRQADVLEVLGENRAEAPRDVVPRVAEQPAA